jgi:tRNA U34 5-methylaminomethyl-2-thiouridine-forming methyltransferase MnmC
MQIDQPHDLDWRDGVPVSRRFDDPFYSLEDGLAEAQHVFLGGNDLPARFRDGFHIAELGFGTGLNFAATALAWREAGMWPGACTSPASRPFRWPRRSARGAEPFPEAAPFAPNDRSRLEWQGLWHDLGITLSVVRRRAETVPEWQGRADAWFLDGFAPPRNPELVGRRPAAGRRREHARPAAPAPPIPAAGSVRRALDAAGFEVERRVGYGRKRHMTGAA